MRREKVWEVSEVLEVLEGRNCVRGTPSRGNNPKSLIRGFYVIRAVRVALSPISQSA